MTYGDGISFVPNIKSSCFLKVLIILHVDHFDAAVAWLPVMNPVSRWHGGEEEDDEEEEDDDDDEDEEEEAEGA